MTTMECKVDISNISDISPAYQRNIKEPWLKHIVKNYDESKVNQVILSSTEDGKYHVIDGQHTIEATRIVKGEHAVLSAKVFCGLTEKQEADLFYSYNTEKKALAFGDKLRAKYESGDADTVEYIDALNESGMPWGYIKTASRGHHRVFTAHDSGTKVLKTYGKQIFMAAARVVKDTQRVSLYDGRFLNGVAKLMSCVDVDEARLINRINETPRVDILRDASTYSPSHSIGSGGHGSGSVPFAIVFAEIYNHGLRNRNKIDISLIR